MRKQEMKNIRKGLTKIVCLTAMCAMLPTLSNAGLQSNVNTHYSNTGAKSIVEYAVPNVRKMETEGNAFGLTETIDSSTLLATSESNNIDVHMALSTEWGTVALLSASQYGNGNTDMRTLNNDLRLRTTTNNKSGIYIAGTEIELMPASIKESAFLKSFAQQYWNIYISSSTQYIQGDAVGIKNDSGEFWHDATISAIGAIGPTHSIIRGSGGVFSTSFGYSSTQGFYRAVVVTGEGL